MIERRKQLEEQIQNLQKQLQKMPDGKLICSHTGPYVKWEQSDGHTKTYIKKKDRAIAEKLAIKKYLLSLLEDLSHEKNAIDLYLRHWSNYEPKADKLLTNSSEFQKLLSPYFSPLSTELDEWMNSPYDKNLKHPENLIHQIGKNEFVRSKSEAIIGKVLRTNIIPSVNLITTYESKESPLSFEMVETLVKYYF